jgi:hypothetical protein
MSSTELGDEFLQIPKLDVAGTNWVIYKDRFTWSIDAQGLLHHLDGSEEEPNNPISNRNITTAFTPAEVALDAAYQKDLKTWQQGEAVVKQQVTGTIPDSLFMKIQGHTTAWQIWEALASDFQKKSCMVSVDI